MQKNCHAGGYILCSGRFLVCLSIKVHLLSGGFLWAYMPLYIENFIMFLYEKEQAQEVCKFKPMIFSDHGEICDPIDAFYQ